jgi:uncharacterized protein YceK
MKIKLMLAAVLLVSIAGCAKTIMTKPGLTQQQFQQDKSDCMFKIQNGPWATNPFMAKDLMTSCMNAKGYHVVKQ